MRSQLSLIAIAGALTLAGCGRSGSDDAAANVDLNVDAVPASADANTSAATASMTADQQAFLTKAIAGDNAEVQVGQLAAAKGAATAVKDFGNMLASDHGSHKAKLADLASAAGVQTTDEPSAEGKATMAKLHGLSGAAFDKAFKQAMIENHQKDIAEYEKQASSANSDLAALARETLPVLRKHLSTAQSL